MKNIQDFLSHNPRYKRFQKPLEAARVCEVARRVSQGRFEVVSFREGLLTLAVSSSAQAANLHAESENIIGEINRGLGEGKVEKVRIKIG